MKKAILKQTITHQGMEYVEGTKFEVRRVHGKLAWCYDLLGFDFWIDKNLLQFPNNDDSNF